MTARMAGWSGFSETQLAGNVKLASTYTYAFASLRFRWVKSSQINLFTAVRSVKRTGAIIDHKKDADMFQLLILVIMINVSRIGTICYISFSVDCIHHLFNNIGKQESKECYQKR